MTTLLQRMFRMVAPGTLYRNLPFVGFLALLGVFYIALGHYAERNMRKIDVMQEQLKEQRWQYMSVHSEVMRQGARNRITQTVAASGLISPKTPPAEIIIHSSLPKSDNE